MSDAFSRTAISPQSSTDALQATASKRIRHGFRSLLQTGLIAFSISTASSQAQVGTTMPQELATRPIIPYTSLAEGFTHPPQESHMRAWWFWHAGMATKASITRDLEAMKTNGIEGVILCDNGNDSSQPGPVFMSDAWKDLFAHVMREASWVSIEVSLNIQSGCGDPGNPYVNRNDVNLNNYYDEFPEDGSETAIDPKEVIDLTPQFKDGMIDWDAPAGDWTVIRYGMTATGKRNDYGTAGYKGGLCYDAIHRNGVTSQWNEVAKPLIDIAKKNGNSLRFLHVDSREMGLCNWTQGFEDSFKQRRGYDMRPYLPVLAGHIVRNRETSDRFLEDFRLTVGDLAAEENYEILRELAHSEGIALHMESAGPHQPPVDGLRIVTKNTFQAPHATHAHSLWTRW